MDDEEMRGGHDELPQPASQPPRRTWTRHQKMTAWALKTNSVAELARLLAVNRRNPQHLSTGNIVAMLTQLSWLRDPEDVSRWGEVTRPRVMGWEPLWVFVTSP